MKLSPTINRAVNQHIPALARQRYRQGKSSRQLVPDLRARVPELDRVPTHWLVILLNSRTYKYANSNGLSECIRRHGKEHRIRRWAQNILSELP